MAALIRGKIRRGRPLRNSYCNRSGTARRLLDSDAWPDESRYVAGPLVACDSAVMSRPLYLGLTATLLLAGVWGYRTISRDTATTSTASAVGHGGEFECVAGDFAAGV